LKETEHALGFFRAEFFRAPELWYNTNMFTRPLPVMFIVLVVFIAIANACAYIFFWYWEVKWLDKVFHFLSGFWLGGAGVWWYFFGRTNAGKIRSRTVGTIVGIAAACALVVGLVWEGFEAILDVYAGKIATYDMRDTEGDLLADFAGGIVAGFYMKARKYGESAALSIEQNKS
jgi:hypothetical protein